MLLSVRYLHHNSPHRHNNHKDRGRLVPPTFRLAGLGAWCGRGSPPFVVTVWGSPKPGPLNFSVVVAPLILLTFQKLSLG